MGISADALLCDDKVSIKDIELLKKFEVIQEMTSDDKSIVLKFLDLVIRDTKAKKSLCFLILLHKNCFLEWFFFDNTTRCNRAVAGQKLSSEDITSVKAMLNAFVFQKEIKKATCIKKLPYR